MVGMRDSVSLLIAVNEMPLATPSPGRFIQLRCRGPSQKEDPEADKEAAAAWGLTRKARSIAFQN